jgi:D-psicose/D-tagatose/L-ribulose 3-epimerase
MRFSVPTFVWAWPFTNTQFAVVKKVADLGFDELEVIFDGVGAIDAGSLRDELATVGLGATVGAYCTPDRDVSATDRKTRDAGIRYLEDAVDFAAAIGAGVVAWPIAHPPGRARSLPPSERQTERETSAASLRTVAEHAGEQGIRLGVEPGSRFDSDMVNTAADGLAFLSEVDHDSVGLLLDTFHMQIEERSLGDAIRATGDQLVHVHVSESNRGEIGTGTVDWENVFSALRDIAYAGGVSVESCGWTGTDFDGLMRMWRPWFDDPDAYASNSLEFVKETIAAVQ